nr:helix-turn-helix transcriptional regulator [Sphingomonas sp.]
MDQAILRLTERQKACLRLVGRGYTSKQIGRQLAISPATVDNHVRDALATLQVQSRAEAARLLVDWEAGLPRAPIAYDASAVEAPAPHDQPLGQRRSTWWASLVPPLGGERRQQSTRAELFAIVQIAAIGFFCLIVLTLGIALVLWLIR